VAIRIGGSPLLVTLAERGGTRWFRV
jgi:hypothetical protein